MTSHGGGSLEQVVREVFEAVDAKDFARIAAHLADDAQGVDEISRSWLRGRAALESYFAQLDAALDGVESRLGSIQVTEWGDAGVVTCELEQTYHMGGRERNIRAPTSLAFRREGGRWKIVLFHSVPVPQA